MAQPGGSAQGAQPGGGLRPYTSPLEREPTALGLALEDRPATSFPATGFDAELSRLDSDDEILRQMAMNNLIAMAKHGGSTERIVAMMIEKLDCDSDKLFRSLAVEALSRSAKQVRNEVTTVLIRSLQDPDANVRCRAVKALRPACLGPSHPVVVVAMSGMLHDESPFVQDAAVDNLLHAITQASFEVRQQLLSCVHKGVRAAAVDSFTEEILLGSHPALDLVTGMLQDREFQVRIAALGAVAKLLTTRDDKVVKEQLAKLKSDGIEPHEVAPAKAEGSLIDKSLAALMSALQDGSSDIRSTVLRVCSCNTAILNQNVFKAVFVLLADDVEGTRSQAKEWVSKVVAFRHSNRDESAYNAVFDLLKNSTGVTQLSAAWIVSKVVAMGHAKYLKAVVDLLENEKPLTRIAGLYALLDAVKNVVPSIMWSSSGAPTVPRCLNDPDRRVRMVAVEVLGEAPEGTNTATQPLLAVLQDNDRLVRNAAADTLAKLLARNDLKHKLSLIRIVGQHTASQNAIGSGCHVGSKYMSLEVGYIGKQKRTDQEVRTAAIRAIRKMGVPDDIIRLGTRAMEVAVERHSLGYRYELTPTFFEEHEKDGTPKFLNKT